MRIFKFLAGLNADFDEVRDRILGRQPPSLSEVCSEVQREETRRTVMLGKKSTTKLVENSALMGTAAAATYHAPNTQHRQDDKPKVWCDFCNKPRHSRETCWKLHGKPADWKPVEWKNKQNDLNHAPAKANAAETTSLSKVQIEQLLKLLKSAPLTGTPVASLAQTGRSLRAYSPSLYAFWIIDLGASHHMTNLSHLFISYEPPFGNTKVRVVDGSLSPIAGQGSIRLSK